MEIKYIAQSGFIIKHEGITIGIDLWLRNPINQKKIDDIEKIDYLFLTHDHSDHGLEDMAEIAKRDDSFYIANSDTASKIKELGVNKVESCGMGGEFQVGDLKIFPTRAFHSSKTGFPCGYIIKIADKIIYHMGDTEYFSDLKIYEQLYDIDVLFIPIGSRFTMGPREASMAVMDLLPKKVIPMHYNTFPQIKQDPFEFKDLCRKAGYTGEVVIIETE